MVGLAPIRSIAIASLQTIVQQAQIVIMTVNMQKSYRSMHASDMMVYRIAEK